MITARPQILIQVTFLKYFALEVWVSIYEAVSGKSLATARLNQTTDLI